MYSVFHMPNSDNVAKLARSLADLAEGLTGENIDAETSLRDQFLKNQNQLIQTRFDRGKILEAYHRIYKPEGKWLKFCEIVDLSERTVYRMMQDYNAALTIPRVIRTMAMDNGIDLSERKYRDVVACISEKIPADLVKMVNDGGKVNHQSALIQAAGKWTLDEKQAAELLHHGLTLVKPTRKENGVAAGKGKNGRLSPAQRENQAFYLLCTLYQGIAPGNVLAELDRILQRCKDYYQLRSQKKATHLQVAQNKGPVVLQKEA